jgi:hypothetical protein
MTVSGSQPCFYQNFVTDVTIVFDNGELKDKPQQSQQMMNRLMAPMLCTSYSTEGREAILRVHDLVFEQLSQVSGTMSISPFTNT